MDLNEIVSGQSVVWNLLVALLLGAIVGTQRGWVARNNVEGSRVAGIRTFSLVGLYGGLSAILAAHYSPLLLGFALLALVVLASIAFVLKQRKSQDISITGVVSLLVTFVLGSLAVSGEPVLAAAAAVITAVVLDNKKELHEALQKLQEYELDAALRLMLISIVMLPLLPNQSYGPWQALNPYEIWWMVVLIASISFLGYFAIKIGGAETRSAIYIRVCWFQLFNRSDFTIFQSVARSAHHQPTPCFGHSALLRYHVSAFIDCGFSDQYRINPDSLACHRRDDDWALYSCLVYLALDGCGF